MNEKNEMPSQYVNLLKKRARIASAHRKKKELGLSDNEADAVIETVKALVLSEEPVSELISESSHFNEKQKAFGKYMIELLEGYIEHKIKEMDKNE